MSSSPSARRNTSRRPIDSSTVALPRDDAVARQQALDAEWGTLAQSIHYDAFLLAALRTERLGRPASFMDVFLDSKSAPGDDSDSSVDTGSRDHCATCAAQDSPTSANGSEWGLDYTHYSYSESDGGCSGSSSLEDSGYTWYDVSEGRLEYALSTARLE
ncbi:hypothetical protein BV25DRAFT_1817439 [Artomyces pyxidatus]|uniref:Uncharacterized protein n=1 Tax=Artomyces pyxidatus TaxID=48021 RepID=A0ACB8TJE9_9AGAM|nr:hypothetical protein BV25DRAFT_1817439 [Artomyces pyxidatus]